jgi:hypothetical protein
MPRIKEDMLWQLETHIFAPKYPPFGGKIGVRESMPVLGIKKMFRFYSILLLLVLSAYLMGNGIYNMKYQSPSDEIMSFFLAGLLVGMIPSLLLLPRQSRK